MITTTLWVDNVSLQGFGMPLHLFLVMRMQMEMIDEDGLFGGVLVLYDCFYEFHMAWFLILDFLPHDYPWCIAQKMF